MKVRGLVMVPREDVKPGRSPHWVRSMMLQVAVAEASPQTHLRVVRTS